MKIKDSDATPVRGSAHDALSVFLGDWRAEGTSFGGTDQSGADPKANGVSWVSTHTARWHTGEFFLIQDERARIGGEIFGLVTVLRRSLISLCHLGFECERADTAQI